MKASTLQKKLKAITAMPEAQRIRLHRSISWLSCAEAQSEDLDIQFITQWIAFNACYAMDLHERDQKSEREKFRQFIANLVKHDQEKRIFNILWHRFSGPVRNLIANQYVFKGFWDFHRKEAKEWKGSFEKANELAYRCLSESNVVGLLEILLDRLYVLRNQLVHGGATYRSKVNRTQVDHGCQILFLLIPVIIELIMEHPDEEWGDISYPVIQ